MGVGLGGNLLLVAVALFAAQAVRSDTSRLEATETAVRKGAPQAELCSAAAEKIRSTFYQACSNGMLVDFMCTDEEKPGESACARNCEASCETPDSRGTGSIGGTSGNDDVRQIRTTVTKKERMSLNVAFEFNSDRIRMDAPTLRSLHLLATRLRALPGRRVKVEGFTDNVGSAQYNQDLSLRRANAVKAFLVEREKIRAARVETAGFGFSRPIAPNDSSTGRARNRRMEAEFEGSDVRVTSRRSS